MNTQAIINSLKAVPNPSEKVLDMLDLMQYKEELDDKSLELQSQSKWIDARQKYLAKQEALARSRAMERTVTLDGLIHCYFNHAWSLEEVADYFGVTEKYVQQAIQNYRNKYGLVFRYNGYYFDLRKAINISKVKE